MNNIFNINVEELINFVYRSGDINNDYSSFYQSLHSEEITQLHEEIIINTLKYKQYFYKNIDFFEIAPTFNTHNYFLDNVIYNLEADVKYIFSNENNDIIIDYPCITSKSLSNLTIDDFNIEFLICIFFIYLHLQNNKIAKIKITITVINQDSLDDVTFDKEVTNTEIETLVHKTLERYLKFVKLQLQNTSDFIETKSNMSFPYKTTYKSQSIMIEQIKHSIKNSKNIYIQAPTGVGKTIASLYAAITSENYEKIFYLTSKTTTQLQPIKMTTLLIESGLTLRCTVLTARSKICLNKKVSCNSEDCIYAKGHFDRVNSAIFDIIKNENLITSSTVQKYAKTYLVCPFELQLDLTNMSNLIIGDYNYLYDPRASLKRYFFDTYTNFIILVDEAHNLKSRAQEMYSSSFNTRDLKYLYTLTKDEKINKSNQKIFSELTQFTFNNVDEIIIPNLEVLDLELKNIKNHIKRFIKKNKSFNKGDHLLTIYFRIHEYLQTLYFYDENYLTALNKKHDDLTLKLINLNPAKRINNFNKLNKSTIYFSATLTPLTFYQDLYGANFNDLKLTLSSPFPKENRLVLIDNTIDTFYNIRKHTLIDLAKKIIEIVSTKQGNYQVFFPSYNYLNDVYNIVKQLEPTLNLTKQFPSMDEKQQHLFLTQFKNDKSIIAFCILGGVFSEGIDLRGNKLIGTIIVGVGLSQQNFTDDLIMDHYQAQNIFGFDYAYKFPGLNKVLQAAGRTIRSTNDKGIIVFIDSRYKKSSYYKILENYWNDIVVSSNVKKDIENFWNFHNIKK